MQRRGWRIERGGLFQISQQIFSRIRRQFEPRPAVQHVNLAALNHQATHLSNAVVNPRQPDIDQDHFAAEARRDGGVGIGVAQDNSCNNWSLCLVNRVHSFFIHPATVHFDFRESSFDLPKIRGR